MTSTKCLKIRNFTCSSYFQSFLAGPQEYSAIMTAGIRN